jgi:rhodanese-related sulfurtransferase
MIKEINSQELNEKLKNKENIVLIDCREQDEWNAGHIADATLIPLSEFEQRHAEVGAMDAEIILQCRSGKRSLNACMILQNNGWENLSNLSDGILGWQASGLEVVK